MHECTKYEKGERMNDVELDDLMRLVDDLGWEFDRMSSSGQETLNDIYKLLGMAQIPYERG